VFKAKNAAYSWVVDKANSNRRDVDSNQRSIQYWATEATHIFGLDIKADTVRKMIRYGKVCLQSPGPGMAMGDEAHSCMEHAISSNINLCQRNGDTELKEATIVAMIEALLLGSTVLNIPRPRHLWRKIETQYYVILELSKEQQSELRRQMWTTVNNLDEWYDRWKSFCLEFGFADDDGQGGKTFSEEQKRWIVNMDEIKLSTDGSNGGIGGRPANSITILGVARAGTDVNTASMSSTLMCGSNASGEAFLTNPCDVLF
jgi:hypothetical protein